MEKIFITNLKTFLQERGITQSQFAKEMGSSNASVSNYLSGQSEPSLSFLQRLKTIYDISLDSFLTKKHEMQEKRTIDEQNLSRFIGSYLLYFYDSSSYAGRAGSFQKNSLKFGLLIILPQDNKLVSYCLFFKEYEEAVETKQNIDNAETYFDKLSIISKFGDLVYNGTVETSQTQVFIFLKSFNDQSLIILNNPPSNKTYIGGLGTANSVSRGREHMPSVQFVLLSREKLDLPEGEIYNLLTLDIVDINMHNQTEKLLDLFKNLYLSGNDSVLGLEEYQKKKIFESALEAIVSDAIETNIFRFAKVSARDDDHYYNLIKKGE